MLGAALESENLAANSWLHSGQVISSGHTAGTHREETKTWAESIMILDPVEINWCVEDYGHCIVMERK